MKKHYKYLVLLAIIGIGTVSCDSILEPSVDQAVPTDQAVKSASDLASLINGAHDIMNGAGFLGEDAIGTPEVMSDNAFSNTNSGRYATQSLASYVATDGYSSTQWATAYQVIAQANIVLSSDLSGSNVDYYKGQAYALRAYMHMYLLLNFGQQFVEGGDPNLGIPYVTTYAEGNIYPSREPISTVFEKIEQDFDQAVNLMNPSLDGSSSLIGYYATQGLMSRFFLYTGEFSKAIAAADVVINSGQYSVVSEDNFVTTWQSTTSPGIIYELAFTATDRNGFENLARMMRPTNYGDIEVTKDLFDSYSDTDVRKQLIVEAPVGRYRMMHKYNLEDGTDNIALLRFAEVWLNKAEALARSGQNATALEMINTLSTARGATNSYTTGSVSEVLAERRLELALEGHRFFDLARHGLDIPNPPIPSALAPNRFNSNASPIPYGDKVYALPIPQNEMDSNPSMVQNKGY